MKREGRGGSKGDAGMRLISLGNMTLYLNTRHSKQEINLNTRRQQVK